MKWWERATYFLLGIILTLLVEAGVYEYTAVKEVIDYIYGGG